MSIELASGFQAFALLHAITVLVCVAGIVGLVRLGQREQRRGRERAFTLKVVVVGLVFWTFMQGYYLLIEQDWADSLPLHVCDLAGLLGPVALLTRQRVLRTTLYFWAMGLTIWGMITPTLTHGPEHIRFWLFWISHAGVIFYAVYDCVVNRYRPFFADWGTVCLVTMGYLAVVLPINLANEGWNYAYIGDVELDAATPLALLPDWPWRILGIQVLGATIFALVWLPWVVLRWIRPDECGRETPESSAM
ncbi:YwaF family protein [Algisphaera agarilytica]|uniref:Putative integral membrane protein (TIGR02206 family) n=1 Tax=Algisphaera agarilytica TaxID=1385975 RepID=A0A7X0H906_9BACT|nr:TIGR02206 family membrane protein [Algisphaera agarilytica]MBB6431302.1 putative integral membrane protein (TIGR02206 family) [Algisphaera agarilytica]